MTAAIKLFTSDGETTAGFPIKLVITHKGKSKRITIGHSKAADWNYKNNLPGPSHLNFEDLYAQILMIRALSAKSDFKDLQDLPDAFRFLKGENAANAGNLDFYKFAAEQITYMRNDLKRPGNADAYQDAINQLKAFRPTLYFNDVDRYLIESFKRYKKKSVKNSTIRTYFAAIRAIYNSCVRLNRVVDQQPFKGAFKDIPVPRRRVKIIYIKKPDIHFLESLTDEYPSHMRTVKLSLLQFYFGGLDLIDLYYLKKDQLRGGRVYIERTKRGGMGYQFDLKVFDKAQKIIDEFWNPEGEYVFPWRKDDQGYDNFYRNFNRSLAIIFNRYEIEVYPVQKKFTSKCMRDTFANMAKNLMLDVDLIRELMGHERDDMDNRYKDTFSEKKRDNALLKIIS